MSWDAQWRFPTAPDAAAFTTAARKIVPEFSGVTLAGAKKVEDGSTEFVLTFPDERYGVFHYLPGEATAHSDDGGNRHCWEDLCEVVNVIAERMGGEFGGEFEGD